MESFTSFLLVFVLLVVSASVAVAFSFLLGRFFHLTGIVTLSLYIVVSAFVVLAFSQVIVIFTSNSVYKNVLVYLLLAVLAIWATILLRRNNTIRRTKTKR